MSQIAGRDAPFRSVIREHLKGHTQALEDLAIEMLARGLSVRLRKITAPVAEHGSNPGQSDPDKVPDGTIEPRRGRGLGDLIRCRCDCGI